ncbi:diphthamide synthesis protein [Nanoarchaeota archaeon]
MVKTLFVPVKSNLELKKCIERALPVIGDEAVVLTTAQHKHKKEEIIKILEVNGKKVLSFHQILGCNVPKLPKTKDILFIGTGNFHALGIFIKNNINVILANPLSDEVKKLTQEDFERFEKIRKARITKFLTSKNIGVIITLKRGQNFGNVKKLKQKHKDKNYYDFLTPTIDFNDLENFNFIDCWINTACPRIGYDDTIRTEKKIINITDILNFNEKNN